MDYKRRLIDINQERRASNHCVLVLAMVSTPERTIYRIIKNFKERGSTAVKKAQV